MNTISFGASLRMLTKCLEVYPYNILGSRTRFCQYGVQPVVEIKDLGTETSENFPCGEKRPVRAMEHYYGGKGD